MKVIYDELNQILKPYEKIIISDNNLKSDLEDIIMEYRHEFDTQNNRKELKSKLENFISDYIINHRENTINEILK